MVRRFLLLLCIILTSFSIIGCKEELPQVSVEKIAQLLFKDVAHIWISRESSGFLELNRNEIKILQSCVKNGFNLSEVSNKEIPRFDSTVVFDIRWPKNYGGNLIYEPITNNMYIYKETVFRDEREKFLRKSTLINKYLLGVYCFQASSEIKKLLKK